MIYYIYYNNTGTVFENLFFKTRKAAQKALQQIFQNNYYDDWEAKGYSYDPLYHTIQGPFASLGIAEAPIIENLGGNPNDF